VFEHFPKKMTRLTQNTPLDAEKAPHLSPLPDKSGQAKGDFFRNL